MANYFKKMCTIGFVTGTASVAFSDKYYTARQVEGVSMQPTLNPSDENTDVVLLDRHAASKWQFERGEVVALVNPKDPDEWLIKRVIATEGDRLKYGYFNEMIDIPKGHVWVEGDNQKRSLDSNTFGPVPTGLIRAKVPYLLWPWGRWGAMEKKEVSADRLTPAVDVTRGKMFFGWDKAWQE